MDLFVAQAGIEPEAEEIQQQKQTTETFAVLTPQNQQEHFFFPVCSFTRENVYEHLLSLEDVNNVLCRSRLLFS